MGHSTRSCQLESFALKKPMCADQPRPPVRVSTIRSRSIAMERAFRTLRAFSISSASSGWARQACCFEWEWIWPQSIGSPVMACVFLPIVAGEPQDPFASSARSGGDKTLRHERQKGL